MKYSKTAIAIMSLITKLECDYPVIDGDGLYTFLSKFQNSKDEAITHTRLLNENSEISFNNKFNALINRCAKTNTFEASQIKRLGFQGGSFSESTFNKSFKNYYAKGKGPRIIFTKEEREALTYAAKVIARSVPQGFVAKELTPVELYNAYKGDHKSIGGITHMSDRRPYKVRKDNIALAYNSHELEPAVKGMRLKYNKWRDIFMDSFANQFRGMRYLYSIFKVIEPQSADNIQSAEYKLLRAKTPIRAVVELDYTSMDQGITYNLWRALAPYFQISYNISDELIEKINNYMYQIFTFQLVVPFKVIEKRFHSFFSGIYPTHNIESWISLLLGHAAVYLSNGVLDDQRKGALYTLLVSGDDLDIVTYIDMDLDALVEKFMQLSSKLGLEVNRDKQEVRTGGYFTFCKRCYPLPLKITNDKHVISYASVLLAINNTFRPEKMPSSNDVEVLLAASARLDLCIGNPLYMEAVQLVRKYLRRVLPLPLSITDADIANFCSNPDLTWWQKYTWSNISKTSPSLLLLNN